MLDYVVLEKYGVVYGMIDDDIDNDSRNHNDRATLYTVVFLSVSAHQWQY